MGRLPRPRGRAVRRDRDDPGAAPPHRGPAPRRARPRGRPGPHRTRHAPADRGSTGGEPARADPARRVPDRCGDAGGARGCRSTHAHATGVRALGAAQPRLLPPDAVARAGRASDARGAGRVPARPPDRLGPGEPRRPDERSFAPGRAVPRAAEPVGNRARGAHGRDRRAHPAAALAPLHLTDRAGGTTGAVEGGSPAAVPRARRTDRAAGRHLRVHPAARRHEAEARRGHDRPPGAAGADAAAVRRLVPGAAPAAVRVPSDGSPDRTVEARVHLPGGPQVEPRARRRLRGGAPAPPRDGAARGLDVVPGDRADQPRGRGAHDRGCRLEHPGLAAGRRAAGDRRHAREHDPRRPHRAGPGVGHVRVAADGARDRSGDLRHGWMVALGLLRDADRPDPRRVDVRAHGLPAPHGGVDPQYLPRRAWQGCGDRRHRHRDRRRWRDAHARTPAGVDRERDVPDLARAGHATALHHAARRNVAGPAVPVPRRDLPGRRRRRAALARRMDPADVARERREARHPPPTDTASTCRSAPGGSSPA